MKIRIFLDTPIQVSWRIFVGNSKFKKNILAWFCIRIVELRVHGDRIRLGFRYLHGSSLEFKHILLKAISIAEIFVDIKPTVNNIGPVAAILKIWGARTLTCGDCRKSFVTQKIFEKHEILCQDKKKFSCVYSNFRHYCIIL